MSTKPLVLIIGLTGRTGQVITRELLANGTFRVAGLVRPESHDKPLVAEFAAAGVELRGGDIAKDDVETLTKILDGADIVISTVRGPSAQQTNLIYAAKAANVKRFVPSEFGFEVPRGVITMLDGKLDDRELIKKLGLPYTFIQVGWWTHALAPYSHKSKLSHFETLVSTFIAEGDQKVACTALKNIGKFVVRIIADPRTLNQLVMTWDGEWTQREAWELAGNFLGEDFSDYPKLTAEQVEERMKEDLLSLLWFSMAKSLYIRGDDTVEKAVAAGALDARELYPDYEPTSLEEIIRESSTNPLRYGVHELQKS